MEKAWLRKCSIRPAAGQTAPLMKLAAGPYLQRCLNPGCSDMKKEPLPEPARRKTGKIRLASGGTCPFSDESGELPLDNAVKILQVIQQKVINESKPGKTAVTSGW